MDDQSRRRDGASKPPGGGTTASRPPSPQPAHSSATAPIATIAPPATTARKDDPSLPNLSLPKGGGAVRSIGEKFDVRAFTGTSGFSIPIATSPGRGGFGPELTLSYDSGNGNGPFGLGWSLGLPSIRRKTALGLPSYGPGDSTDVFLLSGSDDLVPAQTRAVQKDGTPTADWSLDRTEVDGHTVQRYRPRTEGAFGRIERWTNAQGIDHWRVVDRANTVSFFGFDDSAKVADPTDATHTFEWLLQETRDERGQVVRYIYRAENTEGVVPTMAGEAGRLARGGVRTQRYLHKVLYGNAKPCLPDTLGLSAIAADAFAMVAVFDYDSQGDVAAFPADDDQPPSWPVRQDRFSDFRPGFEVRTYRLCHRVRMFHRLELLDPKGEHPRTPLLVAATEFAHVPSPVATQLSEATQRGYLYVGKQLTSKALPPIAFTYQQPEFHDALQSLTEPGVTQLRGGIDGAMTRWVDLDSEGIPGALIAAGDAWLYKRNLGHGALAPAIRVDPLPGRPRLAGSAPGASQHLLDLGGDGHVYCVDYSGPTPGYQMRVDGGWTPHRSFRSRPTIDFADPQGQFIDLNGDGFADYMRTDQQALTWFPSLGREGFATLRRTWQARNEREGPKFVFDDGTGTIHLADMSGDGLTDIVRITNGAVSYWPNLGYGRFGPQITMTTPGAFDRPQAFDSARIRLADVDGSGTTDVIYLGAGKVRIYGNQSGNSLAEPVLIGTVPPVDSFSTFGVVDLLGKGTGCLVWSSPLPQSGGAQVRYVDLLAGGKPYLMTGVDNGRGAKTSIEYEPSTYYYLADSKAGRPWRTRLPFVVQTVRRVEQHDVVADTRRTQHYWYRHGVYDSHEREFRGFGLVEHWDTDAISAAVGVGIYSGEPRVVGSGEDAEFVLAPVRTRTFYHTGELTSALHPGLLFGDEPYHDGPLASIDPPSLLPADADPEELFEAARALRGRALRTEVYADDAGDDADAEIKARAARPYLVTIASAGVQMVQPKGGQRHAVMFAHDREQISVHCERELSDPRIEHALTLAVDGWGNVTHSAQLGYGSTAAPPSDTGAGDAAKAAQAIATAQQALLLRTHEQAFANPSASPTLKPLAESVVGYHVGVATETWVRAPTPPAAPAKGTAVLSFEAIAAVTPFGEGALLGHSRLFYCEVDAGGEIVGPAKLSVVGTPALLHHSEHLVGSGDVIATAADLSVGTLAAAMGTTSGFALDFTQVGGSTLWWAPSGQLHYEPAAFYQPTSFSDPFGDTWTLQRDALAWMLTSVSDPYGNITTALPNYRLLQPYALTDANGNSQVVRLDALGVPVAMSVMGKAGSNEGDAAVLDDAEANAKDSYTATFETTLGGADSGTPDHVRSRYRQRFGDVSTPWEESVAYFDGSGRPALTMTRALPGDDPTAKDSAERWVGSGKVVVDNKGNPVKQYEPFFAPSGDWISDDALKTQGVTAILRYDPLGRLIRTDFPNGTFTKIERSPWHQRLWDQNDTVAQSRWYKDRTAPGMVGPDLRAATQAFSHRDTPWTEQFDAFGRVVGQQLDNTVDVALPRVLLTTTIAWDLADRPVQVTDARGIVSQQWHYDLLGQLVRSASPDSGVSRFAFAADGAELMQWTPNGQRLRTSYDQLRRPTGHWLQDDKGGEGQLRRVVYGESFDATAAKAANLLGALVLSYDGAGVERTLQRSFQGLTTATSRRLQVDPSATVDWSTLKLPTALNGSADASDDAAAILEQSAYTTATSYDALGRVVTATTADGTTVHRHYNLRGLLDNVASSSATAGFQLLVGTVSYNARGQRIEIRRGNGTKTSYGYDPWTFRLATVDSGKITGAATLQQLRYTYDAVGNVVELTDLAQPVVFYGNAKIEPTCRYEYDPAYRLVKATGREQVVPANNGAPDSEGMPNTPLAKPMASALRTFTQTYSYDAVGNLTKMAHQVGATNTSANWTRTYAYATDSSRLLSTNVGESKSTYAHDAAGNITSMPHLHNGLHWDAFDRMSKSVNGAGTPSVYGYDAGGTRVVKATSWGTDGAAFAAKRRTAYLPGGLDLQQSFGAGGAVTQTTWTLSVGDDDGVMVRVERVVEAGQASGPALLRYQLSDLLHSVTVEVDDAGELLGFELFTPYGDSCVRVEAKGGGYSTKRYRFNGKERDVEETGLYDYGARYYACWLGRWVSCDPSVDVRGAAFGICSGNPVSLVDLDGRAEAERLGFKFEHPHVDLSNMFKDYVGAGLGQEAQDQAGLTLKAQHQGSLLSEVWHRSLGTLASAWTPETAGTSLAVGAFAATTVATGGALLAYAGPETLFAANTVGFIASGTTLAHESHSLGQVLSGRRLDGSRVASDDRSAQIVQSLLSSAPFLWAGGRQLGARLAGLTAPKAGPGSINIWGEGEALPRYLDYATDTAYTLGRPLTQGLATQSVKGVFLRSAPITMETAAEIGRIVAPNGTINVVLPTGMGAHVERLTAALGSRLASISERAFTSTVFAPGVDMVQYTIKVVP